MNNKLNTQLRDAVQVLCGMMILAFAITAILKPNALVTGGITGMSIILGNLFGVDYTVIYYAMSLTVLIITHLAMGGKESRKIVILSIVFPLVLMVFSRMNLNLTENDLFLASIYYGIVGGLGAGLILRSGYSTGGTDSIGKIIHKKIYPFISMNVIITTIDIGVVIVSMIVYDIRIALYAIITQIVFLKSVETVMFGFSSKMMKLEIISEQHQAIEAYIMHEIKRGLTKYAIVGGYSNTSRTKIITICSPREVLMIKSFIANADKGAFVSSMPVNSVWGEGVGFRSVDEED